jgi:hypothetical protein
MKLEDKQRLKRFWQAKVLLVTSAIGVISFSIITNVSVALNLYKSCWVISSKILETLSWQAFRRFLLKILEVHAA